LGLRDGEIAAPQISDSKLRVVDSGVLALLHLLLTRAAGEDPCEQGGGGNRPTVPGGFVLGPSWALPLRGRLPPSKIVPDDFVLGPSWALPLRGRLPPSKIVPDDFVMPAPRV